MAKSIRGPLADSLQALLAYRNTPDHPPEPITSNWTTTPANDNATTVRLERMENEKLLKVTPSIEEIFRNMSQPWVWNAQGQLVAIGRLRFSDGTQHEPVLVRGEDGKVERKLMPVRRNAMLGCTETLTDDAGGQGGNVSIANDVFCERMNVPPRAFIPSGRRRPGKSYSPAQSRRLIDEAIANTPVLPPVTKCQPGVASGTAQYSEQFNGMKIGSTGKGGLIHWIDLYVAGLEHDAWMAAVGSLDDKDKAVLDAALTANKFSEVGIAAGQTQAYADKKSGGRRALRAANDNLARFIERYAA